MFLSVSRLVLFPLAFLFSLLLHFGDSLKYTSRAADVWWPLNLWHWMEAELNKSIHIGLSYASLWALWTHREVPNKCFPVRIFFRTEFVRWKYSLDHHGPAEHAAGTVLGTADEAVDKTEGSQLCGGLGPNSGSHTKYSSYPLFEASLCMISVICSRPPSKNIKWRIPERNNL